MEFGLDGRQLRGYCTRSRVFLYLVSFLGINADGWGIIGSCYVAVISFFYCLIVHGMTHCTRFYCKVAEVEDDACSSGLILKILFKTLCPF